MGRWGGRLWSLLLGAPLALAFPRPGWWWLALVGLAPLLLAAVTAPDGREAAVRAWLGGTGFFLAVNAFLFPTVGVFMVPLAMLHSSSVMNHNTTAPSPHATVRYMSRVRNVVTASLRII